MKIFHNIIWVFLLSLCLSASSQAEIQKTLIDNNGEYVRKRFLQVMNKPFDSQQNEKRLKVLIIGDSHAQDFLNMIVENNYLVKTQIRTRYIPSRCQIILKKALHQYWLAEDKKLCETSDNLALSKQQISDANVIILAAFWRKVAAELLSQTIKNLQLKSNQKLFVIGRRSFRKANESLTAKLNRNEKIALRNPVDIHQIDINRIMKNSLDASVFIDVHHIICRDKSTCPAYTDDARQISFDGGHLSKAGAAYLGQQLFHQSQLKTLLLE